MVYNPKIGDKINKLTLLDFCFKYNIIGKKTVFRFDDWASGPMFTTGNSKAFFDCIKEKNISYTQLSQNVFQME